MRKIGVDHNNSGVDAHAFAGLLGDAGPFLLLNEKSTCLFLLLPGSDRFKPLTLLIFADNIFC